MDLVCSILICLGVGLLLASGYHPLLHVLLPHWLSCSSADLLSPIWVPLGSLSPGASPHVCSSRKWSHPAQACRSRAMGDNAAIIIRGPDPPLLQIPISMISFTCPTQHLTGISSGTWANFFHFYFPKSVFLLHFSILVTAGIKNNQKLFWVSLFPLLPAMASPVC